MLIPHFIDKVTGGVVIVVVAGGGGGEIDIF